ncbi:Anaphase-promoting complex subunit 1 [Imshaugia aleurites]|uniref:Anaphase-promoting complex subunit 1 n=1 Tax=Imshaugia aleurites TaxID=172621 RepID=A0A8H3FHL9_9LECA|nr:Anaphase-promoting complex subunit 1 [Imshaugia aleurites]
MASVASLGVHTPSALPFLIAENILPANPPDEAFTWRTFQGSNREDNGEEEELVTTKFCVVWSRASLIQRVFRFDVEGEPVTQAVFAHFPNQNSKNIHTSSGSNISPQHDWREPTVNDEISVRKQRASNSRPGPKAVQENVPKSDGGAQNRLPAQSQENGHVLRGRALVVVLKTQAHVFFLSETRHIVHLPFEVDAVFPCIYGIVLQRKLPEKETVPPTPQLPSVPNNSFAFSQATFSSPASEPQEHRTVADISLAKHHNSSITPLLKGLLQRSAQAPNISLPKLFCLTDPLTELGIVATNVGLDVKSTGNIDSRSTSAFGPLGPKENLLYVSPWDELSRRASDSSTREPFALAVTENHETGIISIWTVRYVDRGAASSLHGQHSPTTTATGARYRRRSSHGPGIGTGTSTPIARGTTGGREIFGGGRNFRQTSMDPTLEERSTNDQDNLLDSAFGDPAMPAKSSRRVSGLLARADLSTNYDRSTFTDLAGAHAGRKSGRRGASFGPNGARLSVGPDVVIVNTNPQTIHGIRSSFDAVSLHEPPSDDMAHGLDDFHDISLDNTALQQAVRGLRKEAIFNKIYSMPVEGRRLERIVPQKSGPAREIFTMKSPNASLGDATDDAVINVCLVERASRELTVLQITVRTQTAANRRQDVHGVVKPVHQGYSARVTGLTKRSGVIDACKIGDNSCTRILVLESSSNGMGELSLQAPWSCLRKIELPSNLCLHNPYQVSRDITLRKRREGGLKRIFSQGPQALVALQHPSCQGRADVMDSDGTRHRLQVQFRPHNPVVRKIIEVAESVLPSSDADGETILRGWWETLSFVKSRPDEEIDTEWTAMIVVLFSMAIASIGDRHTEAATRQKRRKGGLLRSSSGANTDLESWEAMLNQEGGSSGTFPPWMQAGGWEWTAKESVSLHASPPKRSKSLSSFIASVAPAVPVPKKSPYLLHCISIARDFIKSPIGQTANGEHGYLPTAWSRDPDVRRMALASILVGLHLLREEFKLDTLASEALHGLTPILAQIGSWLGWDNWGFRQSAYYMLEGTNMEPWLFEDSIITGMRVPSEPFLPPSILQYIETTNAKANTAPFISLVDVASSPEVEVEGKRSAEASAKHLLELTPRTVAIIQLLNSHTSETTEGRVAKMAAWGVSSSFLETLPESVAVPFRSAISICQGQPSTSWGGDILELVGREDVAMLEHEGRTAIPRVKSANPSSNDAIRDVHSICHSTLEVETVGPFDGSTELDRQAVTRLLFKEDQRFAEAARLVHPLLYPIARCTPEPEWSDTDLLEAQQELVKVIAVRTLSVSPGRGLLFYSARLPLLTEKFPIHGFTLSCVMKPADTTVTADRTNYTEEKTSWAFFHAGVEAGLSISKDAKGIDTSWILFNKPRDLQTRHAGFLLALGLNGHLKSIAKWVAFKYLTPKHTMTSIGLLLGLSASYLGTTDTLITRLLSVHVTRMLPPGAAELNLSPLTQTSGIMGIGLLYCNSQHRRMSEIMISELENVDQEDNSHPFDDLRDEGYRLAAGFALGYINLGRGKDLKGLHDMHLTERLLLIAIGSRKVSIVHILDKATAAATVAIALIFMKTNDETLAQKIDIPDTLHQFDYVRPDMFLLRTVARHLIMWDDIQPTTKWMKKQLPLVYQHKHKLTTIRILTSEEMPFFNIVAGLCLSIGLRFAGSGSLEVRSLLCHYVDQLMRICKLPTLSYDGKLARITVRNCQDVAVLAACCVMAGTGDLHIFRRLRSLHGRTDADTPFGSHLAGHFAIGILFMGGGTHTFGTTNVATASLLCALYPLFPNAVLDNKSHLQAFRHFWVLAAESRCLVPRDVDTHRPVSLPILVTLRTGTEVAMNAPCLLPQIETIAKIQTNDQEHWTVTLDLTENPTHFEAFKRHQSIYVRRRAAYDAHASVFSATMQALNDAQSTHQLSKQAFRWIFTLPALARLNRAEQALVLPADAGSVVHRGTRGTVVDDRLVLESACMGSGMRERLWNLRLLLAWSDGLGKRGEEWRWIGKEVVEDLRAGLAIRKRQAKAT